MPAPHWRGALCRVRNTFTLIRISIESRLVRDWKTVLTKAWSARLILLAGILSGVELSFSLWGGGTLIPPKWFAALSGLLACAAFIARAVAQKGLPNADQ